MRPWTVAAIAVTAADLVAAALILLARLGGIRVSGLEIVYSSSVLELEGVAVLALIGAVLFLAGRVVNLESSIRDARLAVSDLAAESAATEDGRDLRQPATASDSNPASVDAPGRSRVVRLERLTRVYELGPVQIHALREASLDILAGSITVILGPSGSGKTTLLNLLGGIDRATSGRILFDGIDVTTQDDAQIVDYRRERVGFVFQFFNLIPSLTARENVALAAELVTHPADVEKVLRMVGLGERMDHFPAELSGGEQQRVAIARALVKNPPLLLCDEPTGELDYVTGVKILEILRGVAHAEGRAVIVVTHNATIAEMADQVVRLRGGRIDQITHNPEPVPPAMLRW